MQIRLIDDVLILDERCSQRLIVTLMFSVTISYGLLESLHIFVAMFRPRYTLLSTHYVPTYPPLFVTFHRDSPPYALGGLHISSLISRFNRRIRS